MLSRLWIKSKINCVNRKKNKGSDVHPLSIENDPLSQVFGKKAKGLPVSGVQFLRAQMLAVPSTSVHTHEVASEPMPGVSRTPIPWMTPLPVPNLARHSSAQETNRLSRPSRQKMMNNSPISPLVEGDSATSARNEPNVTLRWCELLDGNNRCVAIAREVIDPNYKSMCHNCFLKENEMKVSVHVRKIYPAKFYKETQDARTFQEIGAGNFIVWPKSCIRFTDKPVV